MMNPRSSVFIVQHLHVHVNGEECLKMIGVYESRSAAEQAVGRVVSQPGFCDYPRIIDPLKDDEESGFYIDEYPLGKDHWTEGYVTEIVGVTGFEEPSSTTEVVPDPGTAGVAFGDV